MINETMAKPVVKKVKGKVKFEDCKKTWFETQEKIFRQEQIRFKASQGLINAWKLEKNLLHCGKYGGCNFKGVCTVQESPAMYNKRIERKIEE